MFTNLAVIRLTVNYVSLTMKTVYFHVLSKMTEIVVI